MTADRNKQTQKLKKHCRHPCVIRQTIFVLTASNTFIIDRYRTCYYLENAVHIILHIINKSGECRLWQWECQNMFTNPITAINGVAQHKVERECLDASFKNYSTRILHETDVLFVVNYTFCPSSHPYVELGRKDPTLH